MRKLLVLLAIAVVPATVAAGAGANGSPYSPGLTYGWDGVLAQNGDVRFVTLSTARSTMVAAIRTRGGRVVNSRSLRGFYGVPLVTYDGTAGGLSGDGKWLTLASYGPLPGAAGTTRFVVLNTKTLKPRRLVELRGSWSYDASAPDGSLLYLVEHFSATPTPRYRIRLFDVQAGRLFAAPVVDRLGSEATMRGQPVTRASSADGRWAYTLYARKKHEPFVHALDTERRQAYCIDLPLKLGEQKQLGLRLRLEPNTGLAVRSGGRTVALVDTKSLRVVEGGS